MDYSKTVHLPKTDFPMKADLPKREPSILEFWERNKIYEKSVRARLHQPKYILHDGPPYANGHIHMGHALNKILKDMIVKYRSLAGFFAPYIPGWDCHGLPIEHQLMKELKTDKHSVDRIEFRKKAADFAMKFVQIQKEEFKRLGIFGDWENPYLTLTPDYEGAILKAFRELLLKGYIYRSQKPVLWCAQCETALAEAEVEYEEKESPAVYVKFPIKQVTGPHELNQLFSAYPLSIIIWTTTPWTLPANVGLMLHPQLKYSVVGVQGQDEKWILASDLVKRLLEEKLNLSSDQYQVMAGFSGEELKKNIFDFERPFEPFVQDKKKSVMTDLSVSSEDGSGIVHIAPGHGDVDYHVGHVLNSLPVLSPVDDSGKFSEEVNHPDLKGKFVLKAGNEKVLELLKEKGILVHHEKIRHSYPHCWRCKNPVIFRATFQWFLAVDYKAGDEQKSLRSKMLDEIENVEWVPNYGKNRIRGMVEQRPDWCLSRQRLWGTPLPIFYCKKCKTPLTDDQAVGMVEELIGMEGSDAWFKEGADYFLQTKFKCGHSNCGSEEFTQENDILDVWFDSGVSHEAVLKGNRTTLLGNLWKMDLQWPADLYLEGSDQHRGWFQSSLIPSTALYGRPPYKGVLTHGFIVDGNGKKMSKSLGNVIAPEEILKNYGADILRLWVASSDYREDIRLSQDILKGVAENYRKIRNTLRYLLGNLCDFDVSRDSKKYDDLLEIDRWALMRMGEVIQTCRKAYDDYEFHRAAVALVEFCAIDCSSFYFDILKDRLYTYRKDSLERRSAQTVLHAMLSSVLRLFSPILSFTCEEAWQLGFKQSLWKEESVFLADYPVVSPQWKEDHLKEKWSRVFKLREKVNLSLELARKSGLIGGSLAARITLAGGDISENALVRELGKDLPSIFIVSQVDVKSKNGSLEVEVAKALGAKCARCWRIQETIEPEGPFVGLCKRCVDAIQ